MAQAKKMQPSETASWKKWLRDVLTAPLAVKVIKAAQQTIEEGEFTEEDFEQFERKGTSEWVFNEKLILTDKLKKQVSKTLVNKKASVIRENLGMYAHNGLEYRWLARKFDEFSQAHAKLDFTQLAIEVAHNPYLIGQVCSPDELADFEKAANLKGNRADRERGFVQSAVYAQWVENSPEKPIAVKSIIKDAVEAMGETGDVALITIKAMMEKAESFLARNDGTIENSFPVLGVWEGEKKIKYTYPIWASASEKKIAEKLVTWTTMPRTPMGSQAAVILTNSELDDKQKHAVQRLYENPFSIVSGMPGTGKTTMIKTLARMVEAEGGMAIGMAPTGIAARRLGSAAGIRSETIHQYFRIFDEDRSYVSEGMLPIPETCPVYLIVDEAGMASLYPMFAVLWGTPITAYTHLILVGDENQLRPVGIGRPYQAMVDHPALQANVIRLETIYRAGSAAIAKRYLQEGIVESALVEKVSLESEDFMTPILKWVEAHGGIESDDWQILSPFRHQRDGGAEFGKDEINLTFSKNEDHVFQVGQRVVQKRNNRILGVMNGELGRITAHEDELWRIKFQNGVVVKLPDEKAFEELDLAWATTVHKSQGGEWGHVLLVLPPGAQYSDRALIYTALTRFRESLTILGTNPDAYLLASHAQIPNRKNNLTYKLNRAFGIQPAKNEKLSAFLKSKSAN